MRTHHRSKHTDSHSIQLWPDGQTAEYSGDPFGPPTTRRLRIAKTCGGPLSRWKPGTLEDWRRVQIEVRAEMYGARDVLGCDSSLVDDLIKAASGGALNHEARDLAEGFGIDEIRNMYADPSDWDAEACRQYCDEHGLTAPARPDVDTMSTADCVAYVEEHGGDLPDQDVKPSANIRNYRDAVRASMAEADEDDTDTDSRRGYLAEIREVCREHAQDNPAEVYEWWRVSSWLCTHLHEIGEVIIDNGYGCWWGRTCSGQGWIMDGTLQRIAERFL